MKTTDQEIPEYKRQQLGKGTRSKYFARVSEGSNLVLLNDAAAKAFPTGEAVNHGVARPSGVDRADGADNQLCKA